MTRFAALLDRRGNPVAGAAVDSLYRALGLQPERRLEDPESTERRSCIFVGSDGDNGDSAAMAVAGSIENLVELARALDLDPTRPCVVRTLRQGLHRWGIDLWTRLEGSFGLAYFDSTRGELHLVCDALGGRPLFFCEAADTVLVASEIEVLLSWPGKSWGLDLVELAAFFALEIPSSGRTHFAGIRQVPPGSAMKLTSRGKSEHRFWSPELVDRHPLADDSELAREYTERLEAAVSSFVLDPNRIGIMLSGGLDSTSLAALANRSATGIGSQVAACSWIFDELSDCDERSWIGLTLEAGDYEVIQVPGDQLWPLVDQELFSTLMGSPEENPYRALKRSLYLAAKDRGRLLLLNGGPADVLQRGGSLYLRDLLREGRWRDGWLGLHRQIRQSGVRAGLGALARILRPSGGRRGGSQTPKWMTAASRGALRGRRPGGGLRASGDAVRHFRSQVRSQALERQYARSLGIDVVSPYWTLGFVEFMLSLPAHQVYRPGTTKFVAREAMRGLVSEQVRLRQQPTLLDSLFERGVFERERDAVRELLWREDPLWSHFVDADTVVAVDASSAPALKVLLWRCVSFELWRRKHGWELH